MIGYVHYVLCQKRCLKKLKNKFLTKRRYYQLIKRFDKETFINLMNKEYMYRDYDKFIGRKWILVGPNSNEKEIYSFLSKFTCLIKDL